MYEIAYKITYIFERKYLKSMLYFLYVVYDVIFQNVLRFKTNNPFQYIVITRIDTNTNIMRINLLLKFSLLIHPILVMHYASYAYIYIAKTSSCYSPISKI